MIIGIGTDIVDTGRIEKLLEEKFITRCFTEGERTYAEKKRPGGTHIAAYARRFAAKEACAKALGCGIGEKAGLKDIEVIHDENKQPKLVLHGAAKKTLEAKAGKGACIHLSLSDEPPFALAFVIIEANP